MKKLMKLAIVRKKHPKAKPEAKCALEASLLFCNIVYSLRKIGGDFTLTCDHH